MFLPGIALHPECALVNITLLPEKKYRGVFVGYQWVRRKKGNYIPVGTKVETKI
jgi:hypothetical protein